MSSAMASIMSCRVASQFGTGPAAAIASKDMSTDMSAWRAAPAAKRLLSTSSSVPLAFDKWSPRKAASGTPIVFLHGLFGSKTNNRTVSKVLARDLGCDIYCLDLRNHGDSPHAPEHNYHALSGDVAKFIEEHQLEKPIVIGHSMGARTAMALALERADLVGKLVSVDNGPVTRGLSGDFARYIRAMHDIHKQGPESQKEADAMLQKHEPNLAIRQFLLSNFKREDGRLQCRLPLEYLAKSLGHVGEFNYLPGEYRYTGPTLLIRGTKSSFVPDEDLPVMGQLFPKFEVRDIEAGHWVISENPKEFIKDIEKWLDEEQ